MSIEVDAYPVSRVSNSQPHGIGRVVALDGLWAWNNLGRNVVFVGADLQPRAVFDESVFSEDEPSQYDLDVHAILDVPTEGIVVVLNHLGLLRAFASRDVREPGSLRRLAPLWTRSFAADVERTVVLGDRLVGSRPREDGAPGLLVSERLSAAKESRPLDAGVHLEALGLVTALAPFPRGASECVAVGADGRVSCVPFTGDGVGEPRWTVPVDFEPRALTGDGTYVWAAGCDRDTSVDDYDWEALRGGGWAALDPENGHVIASGRLPDGIAWGNGGVAVVVAAGALYCVGRRGQLFAVNPRTADVIATGAPISDDSLGIAHAASAGNRVVYGFNRGGYRLYSADAGRTA
jgi:hypothetical protein